MPVTVNLLADGEQKATVELSSENDWKYTWEYLPKQTRDSDASPIRDIVYTVEEVAIDGFTSSCQWTYGEAIQKSISATAYASGGTEPYVITNSTISVDQKNVVVTNTPSNDVAVKVIKKWLNRDSTDAANETLYQGLSVTINLLANNAATDSSVELNQENNWTGSFTDLPEKDEDGNPIVYSVQEVWDETNTDWTPSEPTYDETQESWIVTNVYSRTLEIPVEKHWVSAWMPESISVQLYQVSKDTYETKTVGDPIVLNATNEWKGTFTGIIPPDEAGVTYYVYEPGYAFAAEYTDEAEIFIGKDQVKVGEVTFEEGTGAVKPVIITNYAMEELPNTGGPGATFYTAGGVLMITAALFLMYIKKKKPIRKEL